MSAQTPRAEEAGRAARHAEPSAPRPVPRLFEAEAGWALRGDHDALARLVEALEGPEPEKPSAPPEISILKVRLEPGDPTHWHRHEFPVYGYLVSGRLAIEYGDGSDFVFEPGVFIAEVVGEAHRGYALGGEAVSLVVFHRRQDGRALSQAVTFPSD